MHKPRRGVRLHPKRGSSLTAHCVRLNRVGFASRSLICPTYTPHSSDLPLPAQFYVHPISLKPRCMHNLSYTPFLSRLDTCTKLLYPITLMAIASEFRQKGEAANETPAKRFAIASISYV
ncbi:MULTISPECIES: hypothetical protein [unclassified Tolypothrix]|uniref:hypothetical protein n=1 Tax=unclassified Tolypothrix TaxID=2649714 RepID=UPI0012D74F5A|nr:MULTISPECIES: hypothetical protein [unclassified Tolypothrix]MBE9084131.1 hypothetical protein [Tolypothrix sp. LEGE 11397]MBE9084165.1 hypothetical protein [Tolypothrix sp. LEGE 11397]UYD31042.1 hypothetical protein HGR01_40045 [Tolypothrix sp. PCC 7712]UYD31043.1 hypothetical protein HGR01_40050 [Tolypothrix sp. PCC 7712]